MRSRIGFTLIEVIVVISIISIIAAILFAVISSTRKKSDETVCMSNLRQIGLALQMYRQDYTESFPNKLVNMSGTYIKEARIVRCPTFNKRCDPLAISPSDISNVSCRTWYSGYIYKPEEDEFWQDKLEPGEPRIVRVEELIQNRGESGTYIAICQEHDPIKKKAQMNPLSFRLITLWVDGHVTLDVLDYKKLRARRE